MRYGWSPTGSNDNRSNIGATLRSERIIQGLSLFALAHELSIDVSILEAIEAEEWRRLPAGKEDYPKLIAERLGVDISACGSYWDQLLAVEKETLDPYKESLEKILVSIIMVCSIILLFWLIIPGPNLKKTANKAVNITGVDIKLSNYATQEGSISNNIYPVIGEAITRTSLTNDGVLVFLRAVVDTCEAVITQDNSASAEQKHILSVSEPWSLRIKGPFTITLNNAGVVIIEVAGHRVHHGCALGEFWTGHFSAHGQHITKDT